MTLTPAEDRRRWLAFTVLCLGTLMIVLDTTIVNVALGFIQRDLGFQEAQLAWVINAYMLTFGGFLLLGGRLGDLYGPRRLFLLGLAAFTLASVACGMASTREMLIVARALQGVGGAVVSAVSLSLIMDLFREPMERAKAMGFFGFVASGGGAIGGPLGGILTEAFGWNSIFLVNVPIGIAVAIATVVLLPAAPGHASGQRLDVAGALTVTAALVLAVFAVVNGNQAGWTSWPIVGLLALSASLLALFVAIESKVKDPLVPLAVFRIRTVAAANVMGVLWAAAMFAWFVLSALYMQLVLGLDALKVGLAFLPANLLMAIFSVGLSARLVNRFGIRKPLVAGLALAGTGLLYFARAPVDGSLWIDVVPGMVLLGLGAGMAFNPMLLAAMSDVKSSESGLASGIVNTSFMMGGALGLAVLASLAAARTASLAEGGAGPMAALNGGYQAAFLAGAVFAGVGALVGAFALRGSDAPTPAPDGAMPVH
jgi:EmrB/QacA subfamily drug resistance transporter